MSTLRKWMVAASSLLGCIAAHGQGFPTIGSLAAGGGVSLPVINLASPPYNADRTGGNDSTAAINAGIQYWSTHYGRLYLPAGRYKISAPLQLLANSGTAGSGNAGSWTNYFELFGDGDATVIDARLVTSGNVIQYIGSGVTQTQLFNPYFHDFRMYGLGWSGGQDNSGTINAANTASAIFLGYAGANQGGIAGAYDREERLKIDFFQNGIVHSNWVTSVIEGCNFQQNWGYDILDAHDDSVTAQNCLSAMTSANFMTNHAFCAVVGTPGYGQIHSSPDSGNGHMFWNNEVDGVAVFGDGVTALYWNGGDVEDPTTVGQASFILTNVCNAVFDSPHVVGSLANFGFGWWLQNPASGSGNNGVSSIQIRNPNGMPLSISARNNLVRYDDANSLYFPPCVTFNASGNSVNEYDQPGFLVCLFNTNTWQAIPDCSHLTTSEGTRGTLFGASRNQGKLFLQNSQKGWRMGFASYTNGPSQTATTGLALLGPDVAGLEFRGQSGISGGNNGNALQIGSWSDTTPGLDWLEIDIANANGGAASRAAYWSGFDYGTYMQANGINVAGNNLMMVGGTGYYVGNNQGLTNAYAAKAADYALLSSDRVIFLTGAHKATMPSPSAANVYGKEFWIVCSSAGTNAILPNGAETFTGRGMSAATKWTNSAVGNATCLMSDGANWWVLKTDN